MNNLTQELIGEEATVQFGAQLGKACTEGVLIFLEGDLGAGKTTLSRGILQSLGHKGAVKSPTYTLVEPYELPLCNVYHFDLYRLGDPEELEYMGIRDYFEGNNVCLIEWANKASVILPCADLIVSIEHLKQGRSITVLAQTKIGDTIINRL